MQPSYFIPIINYSNFKEIPWREVGDFAEKYVSWGSWGGKSYSIIKAHRNIDGHIKKLELKENSYVPNQSSLWQISKLTSIPLLIFSSIKAVFRNTYPSIVVTDKTKEPLKLDNQLPLREKIEKLHQHYFEHPLDDDAKAKAQDDLATLCELARPDVDHLFKNKLPSHTTIDKENCEFLNELQKGAEARYRAFQIKLELVLPEILNLMEKKSQELLAQNENGTWIAQASPAPYKKLQKQLRYIFLNLLKHHKDLEYLKDNYKNHDMSGFSTFSSDYWNIETTVELGKLLKYLQNYHRNLCLRVSTAKVNAKLQAIGGSDDIKNLLPLTWLHGTRALIRADGTFIPTGWLRKVGITPFTGELANGTLEATGINKDSLSGTLLYESDKAISYAERFAFSPDKASADLKSVYDLHLNSIFTAMEQIPKINSAIEKLSRWNPEVFETDHKQKLLQKMSELKRELYRLDPNRIRSREGHKAYVAYENVCAGLDMMDKLLNSPKIELTAEEKKSIQNSFPTVVGSYTLITNSLDPLSNEGEHNVKGAAELGKDLQAIFINAEDKSKAVEFLKSKGLQDRVKIYSIEQLKQATELNKLITPITDDFLSQRKMALL